jgi:nucleotide-binding universal stress UspA family protein
LDGNAMNTLGTLLVHLDASPRAEVRLAMAQHVAALCGSGSQGISAIEAVYCMSSGPADVPMAFSESAAGAMALLQDLYDRRRAEAHEMFDRLRAGSMATLRWVEVRGPDAVRAVSDRALYADLLFLGQRTSDDVSALSTPADFVESVVIESGKPSIVVPYAGNFATLGKKVLIAWKPCREAARAVSASLPLLQRAACIHLVSKAGNQAAEKHLQVWLRAHGVEATLAHHAPLGSASPGEALLSLAADTDSDLLVMGCYGHSRAREWVLGGVTRTVLNSMTVPVLMAH